MPSNKKLLQAAAGSAGGDPLYVEDVFSTYLYEGNASGQGANAQSITNNIDLSGEGGLTWIKNRDSGGSDAWSHYWFDTERGATKYLRSNLTTAEATSNNSLSAFNSDGFTLGETGGTNNNGDSYVSWSFRKAKKFFDVVTYTGDGASSQAIAHNLGSAPGFFAVKQIGGFPSFWRCYHSALGALAQIYLQATDASSDSPSAWNDTAPTATVFTVGANSNQSGREFVVYLFASDAGGFGEDGTENIIKCGSYTGNGSTDGPTVTVGFEPQWLLIKRTSATENWPIYDNMRGMAAGGEDTILIANGNASESSYAGQNDFDLTATGFKITNNSGRVNESGNNYIYMAIRRGPMKTPESGTEVFVMDTPDSTSPPKYRSPFPVDMAWFRSNVNSSGGTEIVARLTGTKYLFTDSTAAEANQNGYTWDFENGWFNDQGTEANNWSWMLKRAPGFMDVVCYDGVGGGQTVNHGLGVAPEMIWIKNRDVAEPWAVGHIGLNSGSNPWEYWLMLNDVDGEQALTSTFNDTPPTATQFTVGNDRKVDYAGQYYTAYFFGTVAGVSKVGSYNGADEANVDVDCGFTAGARFILIKRTDTTGNWFYWDYERGIVAGNDPYLLLNSTAAQVTNTDYIDPLASGFTVTSAASFDGLNNIGGTYIFLAIA